MNEQFNIKDNREGKEVITTLIKMKSGKEVEIKDYKLYNDAGEEPKDYKNFNIKDYKYLVPGEFIGEGENEWVSTDETIDVSDIDKILEK